MTTSSVVVGVLIGAGLAIAASWAFAPAREAGPVGGDHGTISASAAMRREGGDAADAGLAQLSERIEQLSAAVAALEKKVDALPERMPVRVPAQAPAPRVIDEVALLAAMKRATETLGDARLEAMTDDELRAESQLLLRADHLDKPGARRAIEVLLARQLKPSDRAKAMTELGVVLRASHDLEGSAQALQKVVDTFGIETTEGAAAAYQLVWTLGDRGEHARAIELAYAIANGQSAGRMMRLNGRWAGAIMAQRAGDAARARAEFESILRDFNNDRNAQPVLQDVQQRLNGMGGR
jgi:outer membrane murein-binding lipoprotein Lpp